MTHMLKELELPTLQQRRKENRVGFLKKISRDEVPTIPSEVYRALVRSKRRVILKNVEFCEKRHQLLSFS